jgi:hypothetical protein
MGRVVGGPHRAPCGPVPAEPQGPAGGRPEEATRLKIRPSELSGRPGRGPAERSSNRSGSPSVRPSRRAGWATGRLNTVAADMEVRPSESLGWAGSRAGQTHQRQVWKSVSPSKSSSPPGRQGRPSAAAADLEVRPGRPIRRADRPAGWPNASSADLEVRPFESSATSGRPSRGPVRSRAGRTQQQQQVISVYIRVSRIHVRFPVIFILYKHRNPSNSVPVNHNNHVHALSI